MKRLLPLALVAAAALPGISHGAVQNVRDGDTPPWPSKPPVAIPAGYHADQGVSDGSIQLGSDCMFCPVRGELATFRHRHTRLIGLSGHHVTWGPVIVRGRVVRQGHLEKPLTRSASQTFVQDHAPGKAYEVGIVKASYRGSSPRGWTRALFMWTVNPGPAQPAKPKYDPNDPCNFGAGCDANGNPIPDTP
jgi:hypothetical protein